MVKVAAVVAPESRARKLPGRAMVPIAAPFLVMVTVPTGGLFGSRTTGSIVNSARILLGCWRRTNSGAIRKVGTFVPTCKGTDGAETGSRKTFPEWRAETCTTPGTDSQHTDMIGD